MLNTDTCSPFLLSAIGTVSSEFPSYCQTGLKFFVTLKPAPALPLQARYLGLEVLLLAQRARLGQREHAPARALRHLQQRLVPPPHLPDLRLALERVVGQRLHPGQQLLPALQRRLLCGQLLPPLGALGVPLRELLQLRQLLPQRLQLDLHLGLQGALLGGHQLARLHLLLHGPCQPLHLGLDVLRGGEVVQGQLLLGGRARHQRRLHLPQRLDEVLQDLHQPFLLAPCRALGCNHSWEHVHACCHCHLLGACRRRAAATVRALLPFLGLLPRWTLNIWEYNHSHDVFPSIML
mmetsp:Transcript_19543/g.26908  ORF Transcript_19543/g.26908 Transcript_19543/m.26908 type:complete len:293 (-) Transcript_19543:328-1206(-)